MQTVQVLYLVSNLTDEIDGPEFLALFSINRDLKAPAPRIITNVIELRCSGIPLAIQKIARFPLPLILRVNGRLKPSATVMGHIRILTSMQLPPPYHHFIPYPYL